jgi:hypothetical protein
MSRGKRRAGAGQEPWTTEEDNERRRTTMMDRNESGKKNLVEIWMDGFRQTAEQQAKAQEFGLRF